MDTRVDINIEASVFRNKDRDFVQEVYDFIYGGFVDWIRRDDTGCYVKLHDGWMPVVDLMKKYEFPGARNLPHLARYFFNLGQMEVGKPADLPPGFYFIDLDGKRYYSKEFRYGDMKMKVVEQNPAEDVIGEAISFFGVESLLDNANGLTGWEKFVAWLYCEFLRGLPEKLNQEYIKEQSAVILDSARKELVKMPDSTLLIEMWDKEKAILQERDLRGDVWRTAQNAFMDGFAIGCCVTSPEQKPAEWNANDKAFIKDCAHILDENGYVASAERLLSMFLVKPAEPEDG